MGFFGKIESDTKWVYSLQSWNTKEWLDKSKTGSSNRKSGDINCGRASSRHTGGSMGFDEHRDNWKRTYDREPSWKEIFLQTHLTKKCKEMLRKGDISIYDMKNLEFCTNESKEAYVSYLINLNHIRQEFVFYTRVVI
ncbi:putative transposase, Ptta/En/Spm, plant [Helianthus anomalus]